ncbi:lipopolysaccharide heptosyltransferase [Neisseria weixii]|uniref:Lipopolysaccharide heptosyltransferase n=1 Tax=Neisseria weixii TaxID=1853276 RepID=A0A3N4MN56_9NEIS|nr:lipopolysaccharide heptosyltransferase [Neisseria weixii]RPD83096.1 lipopolysaccharide heptosyltransferase [Neisseria weixii]RPD89617.1 lipopolysaccharide heptosyltransferase [Neisseria weixii]
MLTEEKKVVATVKVAASFTPAEEQFPHYRLVPLDADRQGYLCLIFYIGPDSFLMLEPRIKRYAALKKLSLWLENADYEIYEIMRKG